MQVRHGWEWGATVAPFFLPRVLMFPASLLLLISLLMGLTGCGQKGPLFLPPPPPPADETPSPPSKSPTEKPTP